MKKTLLRNPSSNSKGVTLIEILLVLGVLVVLLSFAVPSYSGATIQAEMKATTENVLYSLQAARNMSRSTESSITLSITPSSQTAGQIIHYSSTDPDRVSRGAHIQDYNLPEDIMLVTDHDSFVFDERGLVTNPGQIILVSKTDEAVTSTIEVR